MSRTPFKKALKTPKRKRPAPFSIRLSAEERAYLERKAGSKALGAYVREKLLGEHQTPRKAPLRRQRVDYELLGRVLAALGKSDLASCLCLLAMQAENGSLDVNEDVSRDLRSACQAVQEIRLAVVTALGVRGKRS